MVVIQETENIKKDFMEVNWGLGRPLNKCKHCTVLQCMNQLGGPQVKSVLLGLTSETRFILIHRQAYLIWPQGSFEFKI
jgi:hypothetical protein